MDLDRQLTTRGDSLDLLVFVHGLRGSAESAKRIIGALDSGDPELADGLGQLEDTDVLAVEMPFTLFGRIRPSAAVARLLSQIEAAWNARSGRGDGVGQYRDVYLVGHSMGGVFLRKAYVCGVGASAAEVEDGRKAPIENEIVQAVGSEYNHLESPRPWVHGVQRIVLLAAMNRGWSISRNHLGFFNALLWSVGSFIGRATSRISGEEPIVFSIRRGRPFITQLRIQWIRMRRSASDGSDAPGAATTVQLLGSVDDMVSPDDSVDIVAGGDFVYLDVPYSSHKNVIQMDGDGEAEAGRRRAFVRALAADKDTLLVEGPPSTEEAVLVQEDVTDVVFVIHGIRDFGYWTQKIARRVMKLGREQGRTFASETSSYGYFPMLPFILPRTRRKKLEWLMDQYAEAVARYPNAERFHYMGHSNGTYLLAGALQKYPIVRFTNVVFAGSVVSSNYNWADRMTANQVEKVLNYTASADWVVAFFPKLFQKPRTQDLGSAGHDGFRQTNNDTVIQVGPVKGGHSAARKEPEWDDIAAFLVNGTPPSRPARGSQSVLVRLLGWYPVVVWTGILFLISLGARWVLGIDDEANRVLALGGYVALIWLLVTRG